MSNALSSWAAMSSLRSPRACWVARSIALRVSLSMDALPYLHHDGLAFTDEPLALLPDALERLFELLLIGDATGEVAREADHLHGALLCIHGVHGVRRRLSHALVSERSCGTGTSWEYGVARAQRRLDLSCTPSARSAQPGVPCSSSKAAS